MDIHTLAKTVGVTPDMLYKIRSGFSPPSPKLAIRLEKATGVAREKWLWPDKFGSPFDGIPAKKPIKFI